MATNIFYSGSSSLHLNNILLIPLKDDLEKILIIFIVNAAPPDFQL